MVPGERISHVASIWRRIEAVLRAHSPATAQSLAPAASSAEIRQIEATIGCTLPIHFAESLAIHNGQNDPSRLHSFTDTGIFLSTAQIAEHWKALTQIDEAERARSAVENPSGEWARNWWKSTLVPFTHCEGDMLCIDTDKRLGEQVGEIVCFIHDSEIERGIAPSYLSWLEALAAKLDQGHFHVDEHGLLWLDING